jgi:prevent-host-death family protein
MKTVGVAEARIHFSELLRRVSKGETIRITRRGTPVAKLVPAHFGDRQHVSRLAEEIRQLRRGSTFELVPVRRLTNQDRRD